MINFKIKNDNFFEVEIDGRPTEVYPRVYVSRITTTDRVKIYSLDLNRTLFDSIDFRDFSIGGVVATDGAKAMNALNEIVYKNIADVVPPLPVAPKIIQSIPMQDVNGLLVWRNIFDNGTETYTLQNGTVYSGAIPLLTTSESQIATNTKPVYTEFSRINKLIGSGIYTKLSLENSFGNGSKICYINATANPMVANSKVAITVGTDTTIDLVDFEEKGSEIITIKGASEIEDFTLQVNGGDALVYISFFKNL
jgi:hypothetical protein